jgi:hypothetical protein
MKAAVIAAFLSGKLIGSIIPMSMAPNAKPQMTPSMILDTGLLSVVPLQGRSKPTNSSDVQT